MFETPTAGPTGQRNLLSWGSLVLALISFFILVGELTVAVPYVVMLRAGPTAVLGLVLGIAGVWRAKVLRRGRGVGITGIVICSLFVFTFLIGLCVAIQGAVVAAPDTRVGFVVFWAFWAVAGVFYILGLRRALESCALASRTMAPGKVWLLLIPVFNLIWHFFVVSNLAKSLGNEFKRRNSPNADPKPGKSLGVAMCILYAGSFLLLMSAVPSLVKGAATNSLGSAPMTIGISWLFLGCFLAGLSCWIVYWVDIAWYAKSLRAPDEAGGTV